VGRVVSIANQKGGVGKTTTAMSLAGCLALAGRRCLLIDADPQANATSGLGVDPGEVAGKVHPLLRAPRAPRAGDNTPAVRDWVFSHRDSTLQVLAGTPALQEVERQISSLPDGHRRLADLVAPLRRRYDLIIVDCPPSLGLLTVNALYASDAVIVPIQCEYFALEGISRIMDLLERVSEGRGREVLLGGFLLTMFDAGQAICREVADEVRRFFGERVFRSVVPRDATLAEAPSHGLTIVEYAPRSPGAHAYVELAREAFGGG